MPVEEEDTRKVQTAVSGSPGADRPVYLPMDAAAYDRFIREYPAREFYCGTLLGGCGRKLSARKYRDKKCHFAHVVSGRCRRVSTNEASADHLYVGRALAAWLKKQKYRNVHVRYRQRGQELREVIDIIYTRAGSPLRHLMRVQLARRSKAEWEHTDAELHGQWGDVQWLFGPDSMLANWQVDRQGHAIRIQCRPSGITRVVEVGVQFPDTPVAWVSLSRCRMTDHGVQAPALELTPAGLARARDTGPSPSVKSDPVPVTAPSVEAPARQSRASEAPGRVEPRPGRREISTGRSPSPEGGSPSPIPSLDRFRAEDDRRATERLVSLLDRLDQVGDDLHLDQLQAVLRGISACEEAMWHPLDPVLRRRVTVWRAHAAAMAARPTLREIYAYADSVRWALGMAAARTARPFTWTELGERLDHRLPTLHPDDKVSVLVEVDRTTCSDRPLLSALVAARGNRVHPLYAHVLDHLDRPVPAPPMAQPSWEEDVRHHRRLRDLRERRYRITTRVA
ncbi:competence protein CoiA family protein [Streptomyces sp. MA25(2023)]|nr:competence protein CoiA family protein [Streptomyces sp. MA25(2023)]MDN3252882.1 competence protein CoiA family protein [Streptomyces sp. MA25(2023)]